MPSYERVLAGAALHRINPSLLLIPSGGASNVDATGEAPSIASVMANELYELGIPSASVIEEPKSFTTQDHLIYCSEIARKYQWRATDVGVVSLFWYFGRIGAIMMLRREKHERIDPFILGQTPLLSVERVLAAEDEQKWNTYFTNLYSHTDMTKTLVGETVGTGQLWAGHAPQFGTRYRGFSDPLDGVLQNEDL